MLPKQRSHTIKDVELLLLVWINEQQLTRDNVSEAIICEKARLLHADLSKKLPETSAVVSEFKAGLTNSRNKLHVKCSFIHFISHLYLFFIVFCMFSIVKAGAHRERYYATHGMPWTNARNACYASIHTGRDAAKLCFQKSV